MGISPSGLGFIS